MIQKKLTWITSILENLFFSGILFGWASLSPILANENFFTCNNSTIENGTEVNCKTQQDDNLSLVFTLTSSIGQFSVILTGMLLDRFGLWSTRTILINASVLCFVAVAVATPSTSYLLFFTFPIVHSTGFALMLGNLQISNLFSENRNLYVSLASGAFDSASLAFLIMNKIYFSGLNFSAIFAFYTAVYFLLNLRTFTLTPKEKVPKSIPKGYKYGFKEFVCFKRSNENEDTNDEKNLNKIFEHDSKETSDQNKKNELSYIYHIKQGYFILSVIQLSVALFLTIFFIASFNSFISSLMTESQKSQGLLDYYLTVFAFKQCAGILICPINGWLTEIYKKKLIKSGEDEKTAEVKSTTVGLFMGSVCIIAMQACTLFNSLQLQIFAMFMQVMGKVFVLASINHFFCLYFPVKLFGKLYGTIAAIAAAVLLLQQPLFILKNKLNGNLFYLNLGLTVFSVLSLALPLFIRWKLRGGKKFTV